MKNSFFGIFYGDSKVLRNGYIKSNNFRVFIEAINLKIACIFFKPFFIWFKMQCEKP